MAGAPNQIAWTVESCSNSPLDEWRIHGPAVGAARSDDSFSCTHRVSLVSPWSAEILALQGSFSGL